MTDPGEAIDRWSMAEAASAGWWGPVWQRAAPRTIVDLLRDGVLDAETAAVLWTLIAGRSSLIVAAGPSGAGKTTLLTALLDFLPPATARVYTRGRYETFDRLARHDPAATVLLVNEISPHLPIYTWDDGVRRLIEVARQGFQILATAHARSVEELAYSLAGYPTRIAAHELAAFDIVLFLDAWVVGDAVHRRVREVVALAPSGDGRGLDATAIVTGGVVEWAVLTAVADRHGGEAKRGEIAGAIARRRCFLDNLAALPCWSEAAVRQAIARWR